MPRKVVLVDCPSKGFAVESEILKEIGTELKVADYRSLDELSQQVRDADALLVCWARIPSEVIGRLERCRIISLYTAGFDNVDLAAAAAAGIAVTNNPAYCVEEVATHVLSLLLACHRRLFPLADAVRSGIWDPVGSMQGVKSLQDQTLGVLGFGRIGRQVAQWAAPLVGRVLAHDIAVKVPGDSLTPELVTLDRLLGESDYVSIHLPLNANTRHMIGWEALAKMKSTAYIINTSRGPLIDEAAMVEALQANRLAGAALDVFETEPLPADHPFRVFRNVIITPHVAWYSARSEYRLHANAARAIVQFFRGEPVNLLTPFPDPPPERLRESRRR